MSQWMEALEPREHLAVSPDVSSDAGRLVFTAVRGEASRPQWVTLTNRGRRALSVGGASLAGADAGEFGFRRRGLPDSIAAGESVSVRAWFAPGGAGVRSARLEVRTDDPETPVLAVELRGLGTEGRFEGAEPSLQRVLDALQVPVDVGDADPGTGVLDGPRGGEERSMPLLRKAGPGPVRVTVMAAFTWEQSPVARVGWYRLRGGRAQRPLLTVPAGNGQALLPRAEGVREFDPRSVVFGLYAHWPSEAHGGAYSEDSMNGWGGAPAGGHAVRFYPFRNAGGRLIPATYVVAMEQAANHDFQDLVLVVENVMPHDAVLPPRDLRAVAAAPGAVALSWADASDNEGGFVIERSRRKNGTFEVIGTAGEGATGYTDATGAAGRRYYYKVRAVSGAQTSEASNRAVAVFPGGV
jgi:hypothetical protein